MVLKYHHVHYDQGNCFKLHRDYREESGLIYLADRIDALINHNQPILPQLRRLKKEVRDHSGTFYDPRYVDAFMKIADEEYIWLEMNDPAVVLRLNMDDFGSVNMDDARIVELAEACSFLIDFQSHFTAAHSARVASCAASLGSYYGYNEADCFKLKAAGYFHDIGKLAIDVSILDKPGKLTEEEFAIVRSHPYYTYHFLENIDGLDGIRIGWDSIMSASMARAIPSI